MGVAFGKKNTFTEDANHPLLRTIRLGVIVWVFDAHVVERVVVGNGETFGAEWEEISHDWPVSLMPFSVRSSDLGANNGEELAPEREAWDCWNFAESGEVEWEDIAPVCEIDEHADAE